MLVFFKHLAKEVKLCCRFTWSWSSIVSIVTGLCGLDGAGFEMGKRFFFSPRHPHWLRGPSSLQLSGYHCTFLGLQGLQHEMMTHIHVVPSLGGSISLTHHLSLCGMERDKITFSFVLHATLCV